MQIREQGQKVQLIRSPYDSNKKRCVQKVFITFKRSYMYTANVNKYLSDDQIKELSADEIETLSDWLTSRADKSSADDRRYAIESSDKNIIKSADAILSDGANAEKAAAIYASMDVMAKALKKAGHPKPKSDKKRVVDTRQLDIKDV